MQNWIKAAVIALSLALPGVALAQSLESLVNVQGVRENQLVGYSLVVGLDGTGDKNQVNSPTRPSPICCASLACNCRIKSTRR